jgi:isoamylase
MTQALPGKPFPLGATLHEDGVNFALWSSVADRVDVCLFDDNGDETRIELPERTADVRHGLIPGLRAGQRYGFRVHGPWDANAGLRCNSAKLLLDPHAKAIDGDVQWDEAVFGHYFKQPHRHNTHDSAPFMPKCVVVDPSFEWTSDTKPDIAMDDMVVYETHVKGLTMQHPEVPDELRGTYAGVAHPAVIEHLTQLGVTTVELLPVHHFVQDQALLDRDLRNYWGYNSIGFLAPYSGYSASGTNGQQVNEFKEMVKALHAAGLEVILDVVYNHTGEGNHLGPTLSFKGIDNGAYYRLVDGDPSTYFDTTGTGNTVEASNPAALHVIMDSLRYWVTDMHVDGFRFDLAVTLGRQRGEFDHHSMFFAALRQDPVLAATKLIAEPWDIGDNGYQVGGFPSNWSEWNGKFRDDMRDFWRGEATIGAFGLRVTGSPDLYEGRSPASSINFITAHDGFTLADLTSYNDKHNEDNGEGNQDGDDNNRSWNCGAEGDTDDKDILALRDRQRRNLLATLFLSHGVPMLLGGDEFARTQGGNNNAYCQDNEISWYDWSNVDEELLAFTKQLIAFRRAHPALRRRWFAQGETGKGLKRAEIVMYRTDGAVMQDDDWTDDLAKTLMILINGAQLREPEEDGSTPRDKRLLLLANAHHDAVEFTLPDDFGKTWTVAISTHSDVEVGAVTKAGSAFLAGDHSLTVFESA